MSLRVLIGLGAVAAALFMTSCAPPLIRCETNDHCNPDMKCDLRQGLCVDEGEYIEGPGNTGTDCRTGSCPADKRCNPANGQCVDCLEASHCGASSTCCRNTCASVCI